TAAQTWRLDHEQRVGIEDDLAAESIDRRGRVAGSAKSAGKREVAELAAALVKLAALPGLLAYLDLCERERQPEARADDDRRRGLVRFGRSRRALRLARGLARVSARLEGDRRGAGSLCPCRAVRSARTGRAQSADPDPEDPEDRRNEQQETR